MEGEVELSNSKIESINKKLLASQELLKDKVM